MDGKMIEDDPEYSGTYYDKACLLARMERVPEALEALRTAFEKGFRSFAHIEHDDDMDILRNEPEFVSLIQEYKAEMAAEMSEMLPDGQEDDKQAAVSEIQMKKCTAASMRSLATSTGCRSNSSLTLEQAL